MGALLRPNTSLVLLALAAAVVGCGSPSRPPVVDGGVDHGLVDAGGGTQDGGRGDHGIRDGGGNADAGADGGVVGPVCPITCPELVFDAQGTDFPDMVLPDMVDLRCADFRDVDLGAQNFSGADLRCASFDRADLEGANFEGANITYASFRDANLYWAEFFGAELRGADFTGADLTGAL